MPKILPDGYNDTPLRMRAMTGVMILSVLAGLFALSLAVFHEFRSRRVFNARSYSAALGDNQIFAALDVYAARNKVMLASKLQGKEITPVAFADLQTSLDPSITRSDLSNKEIYRFAIQNVGSPNAPHPAAIMIHVLPPITEVGSYRSGSQSSQDGMEVYGPDTLPDSNASEMFKAMTGQPYAGEAFILVRTKPGKKGR